MTLKEKIEELYPDDVTTRGTVLACPVCYPEIRKMLQESEVSFKCPCHEDGTEMGCRECWSREYIEPEVQDA